MLEQERLIQRVKEVAAQDARVQAVLLYGSFAHGEGDPYSDLDVYLFFADEALDEIEPTQWLRQIAPIQFHYRNEFGIDTVMFPELIRAEFHFEKPSGMAQIDQWDGWFPSAESCILLDRAGELERRMSRLFRKPPPRTDRETVQLLVDNTINWMVFGANLIGREEWVRAYTLQSLLFGYLLKMVRVTEGQTAHWVNPFRRAEQELSPESYDKYRQAAASFDAADLARAYKAIWIWAHELIKELTERFGAETPAGLLERMDATFAALQDPR